MEMNSKLKLTMENLISALVRIVDRTHYFTKVRFTLFQERILTKWEFFSYA